MKWNKRTRRAYVIISELKEVTAACKQHISEMVHSNIESAVSEAIDELVEDISPRSVRDVRKLPRDLHYCALLELLFSCDTTLECGADGFCVDWHTDKLDDPKLVDEIIASRDIITSNDLIKYIEARK